MDDKIHFVVKQIAKKKKTKAFQMLKHKVKGKVKRSFKEKQIALRNHLLRQRKMK